MSIFFSKNKQKPFFNPMTSSEKLLSDSPIHRFSIAKKLRFSKKTRYFLFFDTYCTCYKDARLKTFKGILKYCFELLVKLDPQKSSFTLIKNNKQQEFICQSKENFNVLQEYFSKRLNLVGFHDKYTAIKKIGKGNFASVFLIENKINHDFYAAKVFLKDAVEAEAKGKEAIINEIEVMRKLSHTNIIKLYEIYETASSYYMIMELLKGGNLNDFLKASPRFQHSEIIIVLNSLLKALEYCHSANVMHRDIKPDNILFRKELISEKSICLADFGLATLTTVEEYLYLKCGTPGFVAPEVLKLDKNKNEKYDVVCDLFSVGVLFHLLLTGLQPFIAFSYNEMIHLNKKCEIKYEKPLYKGIPANAMDLLQGLLEPNPLKRLTAAQALKHPYLTGVQAVVINPAFTSCERKFSEKILEEEVRSEEEILILKKNLTDFQKMDQNNARFMRNLNFSNKNLENAVLIPLKIPLDVNNNSSQWEHEHEIGNANDDDEKKEGGDTQNLVYNFKNQRKTQEKCTIIISRTPALNGHISSIDNSPINSPKKIQNKPSAEDFSPNLRKDINLNKKKAKETTFTLMAVACQET